MNPVIYIILAILLVIILYYVYIYWTPSPVIIKTVDLSTDNENIPSTHTNFAPNGYSGATNIQKRTYTYSTWIYIDSLAAIGTDQTLFTFCNNKNNNDFYFKLYLDNADTAKLSVNIPFDFSNNNNIIIINTNFPLQKWTNIIVSIDTNFVDIYQDGKLALSRKINYAPDRQIKTPSLSSNIIFGSAYQDQTQNVTLGNLMRWDYAIDPATAYAIYSQGNGQPGVGGISLKLWSRLGDNGQKSLLM